MARNKTLLIKEIKNDLEQARHVLETSKNDPTYQEIKAAATSATQAATRLYQLAGMLDVEADIN